MKAQAGFTIIELMITIFIIGTITVGVFGLFTLNIRTSFEGEKRIAAVALANERMEMIRNLPYEEVGTSGGVPSGSIVQEEQIVRNDVSYTVKTDIKYIDDPFDGLLGQNDPDKTTICHKPPGNPGGQQTFVIPTAALNGHLSHGDSEGACPGDNDPNQNDTVNTDYKQARVEVSWPNHNDLSPILLISIIAPQGVEEADQAGTLDFQVLNASGLPLANAEVTVINDNTDPPVNITTQSDNNGRVVLPGLPASNNDYEIAVTKEDYLTKQTLDQTSTFFPSPEYSHLTMLVGELTQKTFLTDLPSSLDVITQDESETVLTNIAYNLRGLKTIGQDEQGELVYIVDVDGTTSGGSDLNTGLEWDTYMIVIDGTSVGYDIKETDPPTPLNLNVGENVTVTVTLVDHTSISLQVTVLDQVTKEPVDNVNVQLIGHGHDETLGTGVLGQVYFGDLPQEDDLSDNNSDYDISIDAPGYDLLTAEGVEVVGNSRVVFEVAPSS